MNWLSNINSRDLLVIAQRMGLMVGKLVFHQQITAADGKYIVDLRIKPDSNAAGSTRLIF